MYPLNSRTKITAFNHRYISTTNYRFVVIHRFFLMIYESLFELFECSSLAIDIHSHSSFIYYIEQLLIR